MKGCTWAAIVVGVLFGLVIAPTLATSASTETSEGHRFKRTLRFVLFGCGDSCSLFHNRFGYQSTDHRRGTLFIASSANNGRLNTKWGRQVLPLRIITVVILTKIIPYSSKPIVNPKQSMKIPKKQTNYDVIVSEPSNNTAEK